MADLQHEGEKRPAAEFWITLALLIIVTIISLIMLRNGRSDQINIEKKTTLLQETVLSNQT